MKKGEFLRFLNGSDFLKKKSGQPRTVEALFMDSVDLIKSRSVKNLAQRVDVENVVEPSKPSSNYIHKRLTRTVQPLQLSKKVALESENTSSIRTANEQYCEEVQVIQRPGALNVKLIDVTDDIGLISPVTDDDKMEQVCTLSQGCDDSIVYHPSAFSTAQV